MAIAAAVWTPEAITQCFLLWILLNPQLQHFAHLTQLNNTLTHNRSVEAAMTTVTTPHFSCIYYHLFNQTVEQSLPVSPLSLHAQRTLLVLKLVEARADTIKTIQILKVSTSIHLAYDHNHLDYWFKRGSCALPWTEPQTTCSSSSICK